MVTPATLPRRPLGDRDAKRHLLRDWYRRRCSTAIFTSNPRIGRLGSRVLLHIRLRSASVSTSTTASIYLEHLPNANLADGTRASTISGPLRLQVLARLRFGLTLLRHPPALLSPVRSQTQRGQWPPRGPSDIIPIRSSATTVLSTVLEACTLPGAAFLTVYAIDVAVVERLANGAIFPVRGRMGRNAAASIKLHLARGHFSRRRACCFLLPSG